MPKPILKAAQIEHLTDARYFSAWYVDYIGFNLQSNPHEKRAIIGWISGAEVVAEVDFDLTAEQVLALVKDFGVKTVELSPFYPLETARQLTGCTLIKRLHIETAQQLPDLLPTFEEWAEICELFVLTIDEQPVPFWAESPDALAFFQTLNQKYKLFLDIQPQPADLTFLLEETRPYGLVLKGGLEEKVGFKSFDELDEIFEKLC